MTTFDARLTIGDRDILQFEIVGTEEGALTAISFSLNSFHCQLFEFTATKVQIICQRGRTLFTDGFTPIVKI